MGTCYVEHLPSFRTLPQCRKILWLTVQTGGLLDSWLHLVSRRRVLSTAASAGAYRLRDRAQHVYQEAALVPRFRAVCNDASLDANAKLAALAKLMDASHASCRWALLPNPNASPEPDLISA